MRTNPNSLTSIGLNIGCIARRWRARVDERLVGLGLTMSKWLPLRWLAVSGGSLPQRRLVELTGVEGPSLVRVLDDLERQGFIERRDCEADRRAKIIYLTKKVDPIMRQALPQADGVQKQALAGISPEELATCQSVLERILNNLEKE